jgi:hypothetical protein
MLLVGERTAILRHDLRFEERWGMVPELLREAEAAELAGSGWPRSLEAEPES